jgi:hypothetical protein
VIDTKILEWFQEKGIKPETVKRFGITVRADGGVSFPYGQHSKLRYGIPSGERTFRWARDIPPMLFNRGDLSSKTIFLCEGETDTMRLRQELNSQEDIGVVGLPGIETWNPHMASDLAGADRIFVVLDNDPDYNVARRVDETFRTIRRDLGGKARRIILPRGINDLCEFFQDHSLDAFRILVDRQPRAGESRFKTLDLTQEPPMPTWAIDEFICQGDIHLIIGEPGIGKSWLTMGMSLALAKGAKEFLGYPISAPGKVLYFDEENPEDLIFHRFLKLGLNHQIAENIRFINNQGLRLDHDPTPLLDEALDFEPSLIVLDSLTRFHGLDENSAGQMAELFNTGIKPLARETGAAVVLIHHTSKTDSSSGFKRSRGSGDITASVDAGYDVYRVDGEALAIRNFKSRRAAQGSTRYVSIVNKTDGQVELLGLSGYQGVF